MHTALCVSYFSLRNNFCTIICAFRQGSERNKHPPQIIQFKMWVNISVQNERQRKCNQWNVLGCKSHKTSNKRNYASLENGLIGKKQCIYMTSYLSRSSLVSLHIATCTKDCQNSPLYSSSLYLGNCSRIDFVAQ